MIPPARQMTIKGHLAFLFSCGAGTEEESIIQERLAKAESELAQAHLYKHTICNDKVEKAADEIAKIILA